MAKETHIKTDKKTVGGWGAWELRLKYDIPPLLSERQPSRSGF
jgi:hypothetical protein